MDHHMDQPAEDVSVVASRSSGTRKGAIMSEWKVKPKEGLKAFYFNGDEDQINAVLDWVNSVDSYREYDTRYGEMGGLKWYFFDSDERRAVFTLRVGTPLWIVATDLFGTEFVGYPVHEFRAEYRVVVETP